MEIKGTLLAAAPKLSPPSCSSDTQDDFFSVKGNVRVKRLNGPFTPPNTPRISLSLKTSDVNAKREEKNLRISCTMYTYRKR